MPLPMGERLNNKSPLSHALRVGEGSGVRGQVANFGQCEYSISALADLF